MSHPRRRILLGALWATALSVYAFHAWALDCAGPGSSATLVIESVTADGDLLSDLTAYDGDFSLEVDFRGLRLLSQGNVEEMALQEAP